MEPNDMRFGAVALLGKDADEVSKSSFNGLPISPSTRMIGRFPQLESLSHESLCKYIEISSLQAAQNVVILISEHCETNLASQLPLVYNSLDAIYIVLAFVDALAYLHSQSIVSGLISTENILLYDNSQKNQSKTYRAVLSQYGLHFVTDGGRDAAFPVNPFYAAPELMKNGSTPTTKSDVWAVGIVLVELVVGKLMSDLWTEGEFVSMMTSIVQELGEGSILSKLIGKLSERLNTVVSFKWILPEFCDRCLHICPSDRPAASAITMLRKSNDRKVDKDHLVLTSQQFRTISQSHEMFYLWKLCGSSVETILVNRGIIQLKSPLISVPSSRYVVDDYNTVGGHCYDVCDQKLNIFLLPDSNLKKRLVEINERSLHKSYEHEILGSNHDHGHSLVDDLPLIVKEKDIDYQASRMRTFAHLILSYPYKKDCILEEAKRDVPPLYRGHIWAALLNVRRSAVEEFNEIDTVSEQISDRQLLVDIPRCHQYEELMTSPAAHEKLRTLLKAWLSDHPNYVYWQGLDSLTAAFLVLNFNDIPVAYASLKAFIKKYLNGFFLHDNSAVIQEYLCVFNHILAYLDAELFSHLREMDFLPELFAIPWFLTCFAHVVPLHKLFHLWDTLLLADSSFPLFIGMAILVQLRPRLIDVQFNDAILRFSDLPDLPIDQVVSDSLRFYNSVPKSAAYRKHAVEHLNDEHGLLTEYTVDQLKEFRCPRISAHDMLSLLKNQAILIIDVRSTVEFNRGAIQGSINFPYSDEEFDSSFHTICNAIQTAVSNCHTICVLDNIHLGRARKFSAHLVSRSFNRVCVLDGGCQTLSPWLFSVI